MSESSPQSLILKGTRVRTECHINGRRPRHNQVETDDQHFVVQSATQDHTLPSFLSEGACLNICPEAYTFKIHPLCPMRLHGNETDKESYATDLEIRFFTRTPSEAANPCRRAVVTMEDASDPECVRRGSYILTVLSDLDAVSATLMNEPSLVLSRDVALTLFEDRTPLFNGFVEWDILTQICVVRRTPSHRLWVQPMDQVYRKISSMDLTADDSPYRVKQWTFTHFEPSPNTQESSAEECADDSTATAGSDKEILKVVP